MVDSGVELVGIEVMGIISFQGVQFPLDVHKALQIIKSRWSWWVMSVGTLVVLICQALGQKQGSSPHQR